MDEALIYLVEFAPDVERGFFDSEKHSENEMLDMVGFERSRYYDRKREAVLLFGAILWGAIIQSDKSPTKIRQV